MTAPHVYDSRPLTWADLPMDWQTVIGRDGTPLSWNDLRHGRGVLPVNNPITSDEVRTWTGRKLTDDTDTAVIHEVIASVTDMVEHWKSTHPDDWPPRWRQGTIMLIARYLRRRNSPSGVETVGDMGVAYVSRKDPDIAQMLEIGPFRVPGAY